MAAKKKEAKAESINIPAIPDCSGMLSFNCGMTVVGEFDGGHRVKNFSKTKLTNEQWMAIASRIFGDCAYYEEVDEDEEGNPIGEWYVDGGDADGEGDGKHFLMSCRNDQIPYGFSAGNFSKFLKSKGARTQSHKGPSYTVYSVIMSREFLIDLAKWDNKNAHRVKVKQAGGAIW